MNLKKSIFILLIILLTIIICSSQNETLDDNKSKSLDDNLKVESLRKIDKMLSNEKYSYPTDKKSIAVFTYQFKNLTMKQYFVNEDGTLDLTLPKDSLFIISLYSNRTIAYTWDIKNNIYNGVIELENKSWINVPMPILEKDKEGASYDRQNFYFKPLKSGSEKIVMRYEHETEQRDDFFEITLNVKIEE